MTASGASASAKKADVLVLGGGPAGLTAGLYAARAGKKTLILEGGAGSRLSIGYEVENYPGFVSIDSRALLDKFREHAAHFAAGDVTCGGLQVVSAAGEGCVAAVQALHYLRQKE